MPERPAGQAKLRLFCRCSFGGRAFCDARFPGSFSGCGTFTGRCLFRFRFRFCLHWLLGLQFCRYLRLWLRVLPLFIGEHQRCNYCSRSNRRCTDFCTGGPAFVIFIIGIINICHGISLQEDSSLTSVSRPVTAAAAAIAGDTRCVRAPGP